MKKIREMTPQERRAYFRKYVADNHERINRDARKRDAVKTRWMRMIKSRLGCCVCGIKNASALSFHHVGPKKYTISLMRSMSANSIRKEMEKCIVMCFNCHEIHHDLLDRGKLGLVSFVWNGESETIINPAGPAILKEI